MSAGDITMITLPPIGGSPAGGVVLSPDGGRAFQTTHRKSGDSGPDQTRVSVINPDDTVITLPPIEGHPCGSVVVSPDGSRAYQTTVAKGVLVSVIGSDNTVTTLPPSPASHRPAAHWVAVRWWSAPTVPVPSKAPSAKSAASGKRSCR